MDRSDNITQHPAGRSVLLHLLPGLLIGLCYFALVPLARQLAYPSIAALMGAVIAGMAELVFKALGIKNDKIEIHH